MPTSFSRTSRSLAKDSSRLAILAWLLGGLFLSLWLIWFFFAKVTVYEVSTKARLEVEHSANPIAALVNGKIVTVNAALGQEVKQGQVLLTLDSSSEQLRLQEEESKLKALPLQITAVEKEITALELAKNEYHQSSLAAIKSAKSRKQEAKSALEFAKNNEQRLSSLRDKGHISAIDFLRAHSETEKLVNNQAALTSEIQRLEMETQTRSHEQLADIQDRKRDIASLSGDLTMTQTSIARLKKDIEKHEIKSPVMGTVGEIVPLQFGSYVAVGDKLATVVPRSELRIVADFPPGSVVGKIHPGQSARMRLEGFPWVQFGTVPAIVSRVGSEIRNNIVRVELTPERVPKSRILMQHGLPGAIEISIEKVSPAILVLRTAGQMVNNMHSSSSSEHGSKPE